MREINFNSREYKQKRINKRIIKFLAGIFVVIVVIEGVILSISYINDQATQSELNRINNKVKVLQENISGVKNTGGNSNADQELLALQNIVDKESSTKVSALLQQIGDATPQKVWYTNFAYTPTEITLTGKTIESTQAYVEDDLISLEKKLSENSNFASVRLVRGEVDNSANLGNNYVRNFQVILILTEPFPQDDESLAAQSPPTGSSAPQTAQKPPAPQKSKTSGGIDE